MIYFTKPNDPANLSPITLLNGWTKIAEKLSINRIEDKLNNISYFDQNQFGFTKSKSTIDALDHLHKLISKRIKLKKFVLAISIDISGAFDSINWNIIINNLI